MRRFGLIEYIKEDKNGLMKKEVQIPLRGIDVKANVLDLCTEVEMKQRYENVTDRNIEVQYVFPLLNSVAVTYFSAVFDNDEEVEGMVMEKDVAEELYEQKKIEGKRPILLKKERNDVFMIKIGYLLPNMKCNITIRYIDELKYSSETEEVRFVFPCTIVPKYENTDQAFGEEEIKRSKNINNHKLDFTKKKLYGLNFSANFQMSSKIYSVTSVNHEIITEYTKEEVEVRLVEEDVKMDQDVVLYLKVDNDIYNNQFVVVEKCPNRHESYAVLMSFYPDFIESDLKTEIILVIDTSGSMRGSRIDMAIESLVLFLRSLSEDNYFNIIEFDSDYHPLFTTSVEYNDENLDIATSFVQNLRANGGTNILSPLQHIYEHDIHSSMDQRSIIVITDGAVSNSNQILSLIESNNMTTRCFSLGIGNGCSTDLVNGIASKGLGMSEFVFDSNKISSKVISLLKKSTQAGLSDIKIDWDGLDVVQSPSTIKSLYNGEHLHVYGILKLRKNQSSNNSSNIYNITLTARRNNNNYSFSNQLDMNDIFFHTDLIHKLAVKHIINEDLELPKNEIVQYSEQYGILSKYTSFVGCSTIPSSDNIDNVDPVFIPITVSSYIEDSQSNSNYQIINGKKMRIASTTTSKTGKHGHAKVRVVGFDENGKKFEQIITANEYNQINKNSLPPSSSSSSSLSLSSSLSSSSSSGNNNNNNNNRDYNILIDSLRNIVIKQKSQGFWPFDSLVNITNLNLSTLQNHLSSFCDLNDILNPNNSADFFATYLVYLNLKKQFIDESDQLELIYSKTYKWISSFLKSNLNLTSLPFNMQNYLKTIKL